MKGVYVLILRLDRPQKLNIGKLGLLTFQSGYYAYVGSALNSLEKRIDRHLRKNKKLHWHIDYLTLKAKPVCVIFAKTEFKIECKIANELSDLESVKGFGCTDCNCKSHLFYARNLDKLIKNVKEAFVSVGLKPARKDFT